MGPKTKRFIGRLLGLGLAATLVAKALPASAWQYTLNGASPVTPFVPDVAYTVVIDSAGDIIAGGNIGVNPYVCDGLVVKLSGQLGAPSVLWQRRFTSDSSIPMNRVYQVALDAAGNVLVGGMLGGADQDGNVSVQLLVAKLDGATGAILWQQVMFPMSNILERAVSVALDSVGNVIVAGEADPDADGTGNSAVVKFDGVSGTVLWQAATGPNYSVFDRVALDHADNVLAGGNRRDNGGAAIAKYNGTTGAELWVAVDGTGGTYRALVVDASGDVFAGGYLNADRYYFRVRKLTADGADVWDFQQPEPPGADGARGLILDSAGNVFATGQGESTNPANASGDMATFKLDGATGAVLWQSSIDGGSLKGDWGNAIVLDPAGNPVVGGTLTMARGTMAILKLDATTGGELWRAVVDGAGADSPLGSAHGQGANAIAVDPLGDVVAAGMLNAVTGNDLDFAIVKLNGTDGTDFVELCGNGVIEGTETCDDGNTAAGDGCSDTCQVEAGFLCLGQPSSCVVPVGVAPKKLVVVDKLAASGLAKTVFAAKDPNVAKGAGTDTSAISATFTAAYSNGAARGGFTVPAGTGWLVNTAKAAKYVNKSAPAGPTQTKVALIRPGSALSLTAKGIGDTPFDILAAGDPAGVVNTAYCVTNGGETFCHCSVNQNCVFKPVAADTGAKLVCKGGVADPTCAALVP